MIAPLGYKIDIYACANENFVETKEKKIENKWTGLIFFSKWTGLKFVEFLKKKIDANKTSLHFGSRLRVPEGEQEQMIPGH